jgi:hypothetical protein
MLGAVVAEALGPILDWGDDGTVGEARIASLYRTAFPRLFEHEATFRAALRQSLDPEAEDAILGRGHRRELLARATAGLDLPPDQARRLRRGLSLTFGVEAMIVLKDIWGLADSEAEDVAIWAAHAMLAAVRKEAGLGDA